MTSRRTRIRPRRGDIWWANLSPTIGSEQADHRPVLILSADRFHDIQNRLVLIAPMTQQRKNFAFHIDVTATQTGLDRPGTIMCDQVRAISPDRFTRSAASGRLAPEILHIVEDRICILLDLPCRPRDEY